MTDIFDDLTSFFNEVLQGIEGSFDERRSDTSRGFSSVSSWIASRVFINVFSRRYRLWRVLGLHHVELGAGEQLGGVAVDFQVADGDRLAVGKDSSHDFWDIHFVDELVSHVGGVEVLHRQFREKRLVGSRRELVVVLLHVFVELVQFLQSKCKIESFVVTKIEFSSGCAYSSRPPANLAR